MIETILPDAVVCVEAREDSTDVVLFAAEESSVGQAVEKRRREFTTARACVREAFAQLGLPATAVANGPHGEPLWPAGIVGSITHCEGYRACALARSSRVLTIGIDAEPNAALPAGVLCDIAGARELEWLEDHRRLEPGVHWDRLLFSAKEAVYKAWFPLAGRWLGFEDAELSVAPETRRFTARLLVPGPSPAGRRLTEFSGRWLVRDGLLLTAIVLPSPQTEEPPEAPLSPSSADPRPSR